MTIACPACRADNADRTCRRCRSDLSLLWDLEARRQSLLANAAHALRRRDSLAAIELAEQALELRQDADGARVIACAHLLRGKFGKAMEWHRRGVG